MITKKVIVTQEIEVTVDETRFTEEYLETFRDIFYDFEGIDDHIKHLAQMYARGVVGNWSFIEGYGDAKEFGISFKEVDQAEEIEEGLE